MHGCCAVLLLACCFSQAARAQVIVPPGGGEAIRLPSAADVNRVMPELESKQLTAPGAMVIPENIAGTPDVPEEFKSVHLTLSKVNIKGMTVFTEDEVADIYAEYIGEDITLDKVWEFAAQLTVRYRDEEYFLSRAYVPMQEIEHGVVTIQVTEGYIGKVTAPAPWNTQYNVRKYIERLKERRPIKASHMESFMLKLNDLPGASFFGALQPLEGAPEGEIELVLKHTDVEARTTIGVDNAGSRFLGPYQAHLTYEGSIIPLQKTSITAAGALDGDELRAISATHSIPIYPQWTIDLYGSHVKAEPGANLKLFDIHSSYTELGVGVKYQPIRQYLENLSFSAKFDGKNTNSDIFDNIALTRDRIRALRMSVNYDVADGLDGYNYFQLGMDQGLDVLSASQAGELNLSRAEAEPDFTVGNFSYTRFQALPHAFMLVGQAQGQYASKPLYSAEEFGYGGQAIGRAYDPSEIVGDHGLAGIVELRYLGLPSWNDTRVAPYGFYDIGKVWNEDAGARDISGSSAGFGDRCDHRSGIKAALGIAFPLTKDVDMPLYGNGKSPRFLVQLQYGF